jgi:bacterioferritin
MKGDPKVIELLNEGLKAELTAINQYWLHYRILDNWGVTKLAAMERHESIDEMKHADKFSERILFLDGLPNFQSLGSLRIGESVEEILKADLEAKKWRISGKNLLVTISRSWVRQRACPPSPVWNAPRGRFRRPGPGTRRTRIRNPWSDRPTPHRCSRAGRRRECRNRE